MKEVKTPKKPLAYYVVVKLFCNICGQIQKLLHIKYT